jgi:hypothetical protein
MKHKPNSNLLTIADSPTQQHLVCIFLLLYIYREIQMVLGSPNHITEKSLDNETVRSDRLVSTLCKTDVATWRHKVSHEAFGGVLGEENYCSIFNF